MTSDTACTVIGPVDRPRDSLRVMAAYHTDPPATYTGLHIPRMFSQQLFTDEAPLRLYVPETG